jgi:hypothetical protein
MKSVFILSLRLADATLSLNSNIGGYLFPSTLIVNSDSYLEFYSLTSSSYSTFSAGDCFEIELDQVEAYETMSSGYYEPFSYTDLEDCTFTPAAECTRVSA